MSGSWMALRHRHFVVSKSSYGCSQACLSSRLVTPSCYELHVHSSDFLLNKSKACTQEAQSAANFV